MNTESHQGECTMNTQRRHKKADPVVPYMTIVECLQCIVDHGKHSKALNNCVNYAKHGIKIYEQFHPFLCEEDEMKYYKEMHMQLLHVLGNMTHWRGETATNVRVNLRNIANRLSSEVYLYVKDIERAKKKL
jgi:hypothetical protein